MADLERVNQIVRDHITLLQAQRKRTLAERAQYEQALQTNTATVEAIDKKIAECNELLGESAE